MGALSTDGAGPRAGAAPLVDVASAAGVSEGALEGPLPGLRAWFVFFVLWMGGLAGAFRIAFYYYEHGSAAALPVWLLCGLTFYLSLCNAFLPLPTSVVVMLAASNGLGLFETGWLRVLAVALAGGAATSIANLNEYHVLAFLLRYGLDRRIRKTKVYGWAIRWFNVAPFQTLTLISFVPIPIDAVRWLAILRRYSRGRFAGAYFCGRFLRYALLAGFTVAGKLSPRTIIGIQVAIVLVFLGRIVWAGMRGRARTAKDYRGGRGDR